MIGQITKLKNANGDYKFPITRSEAVFVDDETSLSDYLANYKGKYLSILGDSISTYSGYIPVENTNWYDGTNCGVSSVNQTWWKRLLDQTGMNLCINNSWSGSRVTTTHPTYGTAGAGSMTRATSLHNGSQNPDVIIIFMGINDFNNEVAIGSYSGSGVFPTDTTTFKEAYSIMLSKILSYYKNAEIYVCTLPYCERNGTVSFPETNDSGVLLSDWNKAIISLADIFGVNVIDLNKSGLTYQNIEIYSSDNLHPNALGHKLIANKAIKTISPISNYSTL